jgi:hypothetical protein
MTCRLQERRSVGMRSPPCPVKCSEVHFLQARNGTLHPTASPNWAKVPYR